MPHPSFHPQKPITLTTPPNITQLRFLNTAKFHHSTSRLPTNHLSHLPNLPPPPLTSHKLLPILSHARAIRMHSHFGVHVASFAYSQPWYLPYSAASTHYDERSGSFAAISYEEPWITIWTQDGDIQWQATKSWANCSGDWFSLILRGYCSTFSCAFTCIIIIIIIIKKNFS